jgi:thiol:disulfide interchange protein
MVWLTELADALEGGRSQGSPVFVLATVDWCPWCVKLDENVLVDERVLDALEGVVCARLNGDDNDQLPYDYDFDIYPTTLIFRPDGQFHTKIEGYHDPDEYLEQLEQALAEAALP